MTETDAAAKPVEVPVTFLPYLEKYRLYKLFHDMMQDLVLHTPRDPLKHMKHFLMNREVSDSVRLILLLSPELDLDVHCIVRAMIKDFGVFVITRRTVLDHYEKHDDFKPGCVDPALMAEVTKSITMKDEVVQNGWLMYDHPCTLREARCLQQDGVIPTVTLSIIPTPPVAPPADNPRTYQKHFFQQDFEALQYAYRTSLKEVHIDPEDTTEIVSNKCFNAIRACSAGAQGAGQGLHANGAPGVYRVALVGPRGSGRKTQAALLAKQFGLVCLSFDSLFAEASARDDDLGKWLRKHGPSVEMKAQIVRRRLLEKDCIDQGYVITGFPTSGAEFELFEHMETPPNRIVFMNIDLETCKQRLLSRGVDWCTGKITARGAPRSSVHPRDYEHVVETESASQQQIFMTNLLPGEPRERQLRFRWWVKQGRPPKHLDFYFSDGVAEMRAAAGLSAWEIDCDKAVDQVQTKIQAAVMAAPSYDIKCYSATGTLENARAD